MLRRVRFDGVRRACHVGSKRWMSMAGSVQFYRRQMIVLDRQCDAEAWPKKLEESSTHVLSKYHKAVEPFNKDKTPTKLIMAAAYRHGDVAATASVSAGDSHDLLVFPDNICISGVRDSDVDFVTSHLLEESLDLPLLRSRLSVSDLTGHHVFVCAHAKRDFRCACAGPKLMEWFQAKRPSPDDWTIYACSHFGGHRFAGNCIVYPEGHWYGLVNEPSDVDRVIEAITVAKQPVVPALWRGCINTTKASQLALHQAVASVAAPDVATE